MKYFISFLVGGVLVGILSFFQYSTLERELLQKKQSLTASVQKNQWLDQENQNFRKRLSLSLNKANPSTFGNPIPKKGKNMEEKSQKQLKEAVVEAFLPLIKLMSKVDKDHLLSVQVENLPMRAKALSYLSRLNQALADWEQKKHTGDFLRLYAEIVFDPELWQKGLKVWNASLFQQTPGGKKLRQVLVQSHNLVAEQKNDFEILLLGYETYDNVLSIMDSLPEDQQKSFLGFSDNILKTFFFYQQKLPFYGASPSTLTESVTSYLEAHFQLDASQKIKVKSYVQVFLESIFKHEKNSLSKQSKSETNPLLENKRKDIHYQRNILKANYILQKLLNEEVLTPEQQANPLIHPPLVMVLTPYLP